MVAKTLVWLDCDPGHDDAMAIILAGYHPNIQLLGISTVCGNQQIEKVTKNTLRVLAYAGLAHTVDVYDGVSRPLLVKSLHAEEIHGESGMELNQDENVHCLDFDKITPITQKKNSKKAFLALQEAVIDNPNHTIKVVCTAPLTNMALFLTAFPELIPRIEVICMGGCIGIGNKSPAAEFNFLADPQAASIVFNSGVKLTMIPLEVTHLALFTTEVSRMMFPTGFETPYQKFIYSLLMFFEKSYKEVFGFDFPPLHDPCAVYYAIEPQNFKVELLRVDIDTHSALCAGRSVCDVYNISHLPKNCYVGKSMQVGKFWKSMSSAVQKANLQSPLNIR